MENPGAKLLREEPETVDHRQLGDRDAGRQSVLTLVRTQRGIAVSYANWAVGLLIPMLMVPMLVRFLGHELYGQWAVILSLTSYVGLANFGSGQTVGNMVVEASAKPQARLLGQVVSTAFFFHVLIAIPLLLVSALLAIGYFVRFLPLHAPGAELALSLTCGSAALALPLKVSSMTLRSVNRVDLEQTTQTSTNLLRAAVLVVVLLAGLKLVAVAAVYALALIASGFATYVIVNRLCAEAQPRINLFSWPLLKRMIAPSAAFLVLMVASTLAFSIDNLVIAYNLGARAVTQYSVPFQIVMLNIGFFAVALGAITPAITDHHTRAANDVLSSGYVIAMRVAILYGASSLMFLWLAGQPILELWVGPGVFPGFATFGLQLLLLFVQVLLYPAHTVLIATSRHYTYSIIAITEALLNVLLSVWWVHRWGMPGVIAGTVVARLLTNGWFLTVAALKVLQMRVQDLARCLIKGALLSSSSLVFAALLRPHLSLVSEIAAIGISCAAVCVFIAVFLTFELNAEERSLLGSMLFSHGDPT